MNWKKTNWIHQMQKNPTVSLPLCGFPLIKLKGWAVENTLKSLDKQIEIFQIMDCHPQMGAIVTFMDLSIEAEQFNSPIRFSSSEAPSVEQSIINEGMDLDFLQPTIHSKRIFTNIEAVRQASKTMNKPIFAGAIGPFSLAGRLIKLSELMVQCFIDPIWVHQLMKKATTLIISYIKQLKEAGAKGVILAEPAAGLLDPENFAHFSNQYVKEICNSVVDEEFLFIYHNCGPIIPLLSEIVTIPADGFHFGNAVELGQVIKYIPNNKLVFGNIDPVGVLNKMQPFEIKEQVKKLLNEMSKYSNYICSTGCDVPYYTPLEKLDAYFKAIEEFYEHN